MKKEVKELQRTWLVQRLCRPIKATGPLASLANAFSFGGGLKNGGLSDKFMEFVNPIFSFDYMGSAEFEFGAVPKSFQFIANNIKQYCVGITTINETEVYFMCQKELKEQIAERIKELAKNKHQLKEYCGLDVAVGLDKYSKKEECRYAGWLELNNNFMFFTSKEMFEGVANIFGFPIKQ